MKTVEIKVARAIPLIAFLIISNFVILEGQIAQIGEFMISGKMKQSEVMNGKDCPDFTCVLEMPDINFDTLMGPESSQRTQFVIDSVKFEIKKSDYILRLKKQLDSIKIILSHIEVMRIKITTNFKLGFETELLKTFDIISQIENQKNIVERNITIMDTLKYKNEKSIKLKIEKSFEGFHSVQNKLKSLLDQLSAIEKTVNLKIEEEKAKNVNTGLTPQLADIFESISPTISLLGTSKIKNFGVHAISIYTGLVGDTLSYSTIIIPELSKYGISVAGYFDLDKLLSSSVHDKIWLNYAINFHNKKTFDLLNNDTYSFSRIQSRIGLEFFIFKDILTMYYNFNWIKPITNVELYRENFNIPGYNQVFSDAGFKFLLKTSILSKESTGIFADLNFLFLNDSFDRFNLVGDFIRPVIKVGFQQNFR
jgi:hypothetical protein